VRLGAPAPRSRRLLAATGALAAATGAVAMAPAAPAAAADPQTRVVVLVVDGLRPDEVALMPFLSQLAASGRYYTEARSVMVAETVPNHVAMVTGTYPDRNGIVANDFPDSASGTVLGNDARGFLQSDSVFTLVADQCPDLTAAAVTSKDYLFEVMSHDRNRDDEQDADSNFDNTSDPTFIPVAGLTPDERTIAEATRVLQQDDPDFLFVNLGSVDRVGHVDEVGGVTSALPTGSRPVARDAQRTLTDTYLRAFVELLQADERWAETAVIVTADHSMDWSLPTSTVSLSPAIEADPLLAGEVVVAQNGGAALYSLTRRGDARAAERLKRLREIAIATEGVDEALYRQPNPLDGGTQHWVGRVHPDWHQTHPRSGDLLVTVEDGLRVTEPSSTSNPIPGNHGMPSTLRIPMVVAGGLPLATPATVSGSSDPFVRAADQAENVDVAPTAAWLLGLDAPAGGFDGRPLTEAFAARPADSCLRAAGGPGTVAPPPMTGAPQAPGTGALPTTGLTGLPLVGGLLLVAAVAARRRRAHHT
jgi:hypothetical protein